MDFSLLYMFIPLAHHIHNCPCQDPTRASRLYKQDLDFVKDFINNKGLLDQV